MIEADGASPGRDASRAIDATGATDVAPPSADANCGRTILTGSHIPNDFLVVQDRSVSTDPASWNAFLSQVGTTMLAADDDPQYWGLYAFPKDGPACTPATISGAIDVAPAPLNGRHVVAHMVAAGTGASGTPAATAIDLAAGYLLSLVDGSAKFLLLVTDGAPTCAGRMGTASLDPEQAQADAVAAIAAARDLGVETFVLVPSTVTAASDIVALNALAEAGGRPRQPDPRGIRFVTEKTFPELFGAPIDHAQFCRFMLQMAPAASNADTVTLNGAVIPRDTGHIEGWDYTGPTPPRAITLYGAWCDQLLASRTWQLEVFFGCLD
jgi:hypothetical protein